MRVVTQNTDGVPVIEQLAALGFTPYKPLVAKSRQRLFAKIRGMPHDELDTFFASCNGGRVTTLACRFYRLGEAVDLVRNHFACFNGFSLLPLLVHKDMESDPCAVVLSGPLRGYIYWHPHDDTPKLLAPSLKSFIRALPKWRDSARCIENTNLIYPKCLSKKERSTYGRAITYADEMLNRDYDGQFVRDLALSMRSEGRGAAFINKCVDCLRSNGIDVENTGYYLFIGPRKVKFCVQYYEKERNRPNFDEFFVDRIRSLRLDK